MCFLFIYWYLIITKMQDFCEYAFVETKLKNMRMVNVTVLNEC